MKTIYNLFAAMPAMLLMGLASCSGSDDWTPGPDVAPECMGVYFAPMESYSIVLEPDDSRLVPVTIGRADATAAASVEITVAEAPDGVKVPGTVDFKAGEPTATIFIDLENMASKSSGTVSLSLPEKMTSPYGAGTPSIDLAVTVSGAWIPVSDNVVLSFSKTYPDMVTTLYNLDGTYNFKLPNFMGSGLDFVFTCTTPGAGTLGITPLTNYLDVHDYWGSDYSYNGWILYDDATEELPEWSIDGTYPNVTFVEFDSDYASMNIAGGSIYFGPYMNFSDGSAGYIDLYLSFTPEFDPFAAFNTTD